MRPTDYKVILSFLKPLTLWTVSDSWHRLTSPKTRQCYLWHKGQHCLTARNKNPQTLPTTRVKTHTIALAASGFHSGVTPFDSLPRIITGIMGGLSVETGTSLGSEHYSYTELAICVAWDGRQDGITLRRTFPHGGQPQPCPRPLMNQSSENMGTVEDQEKATLMPPTKRRPIEKSQRALIWSDSTPLMNLLMA